MKIDNLNQIENLINRYLSARVIGYSRLSPFSEDSDGRERRMVLALQSVIQVCKSYENRGDTISLSVVEDFQRAIVDALSPTERDLD
jgi:hypothetical protein